MNKQRADYIMSRMSAVLTDLGEAEGVSITVRRGRFGKASGTITVDYTEPLPSGRVMPKIGHDFLAKCRRYGFEPDDLGRTFKVEGKTHKIIGLVTRNRRYPIITKSGGIEYKFAPFSVLVALGRRSL